MLQKIDSIPISTPPHKGIELEVQESFESFECFDSFRVKEIFVFSFECQ